MRPRKLVSSVVVTAVAGLVVFAAGPARAAFPGVNGVILFDYRGAGDPGNQIWSVDPVTKTTKDLSHKNFGDDQPSASSNGKKITFRNDGDVWVMRSDGSRRTDLTPGYGNASDPAWSPDATKIVFAGNGGLEVVKADGTGMKAITSGDDSNPSWSPDGASIAFASYRNVDVQQIWTCNTKGHHLVDVSQDSTYGENDPDWSPDGATIAFNTNRSMDGERENFAIDPDGSDPHEITAQAPSGTYYPAYSPDGTEIAFTANFDGSGQVAVQSVSQPPGFGVRITDFAGDSIENLSWSPKPTA